MIEPVDFEAATGVRRTETSVTEDSATVVINVFGASVTFTFGEIALAPHKMLTTLKVDHDLGAQQENGMLYKRSILPHEAHLDVLSPSGVESYRRTLDQVYGKDIGWAALLSEAIARARAAYIAAPQAVDLDLVPLDFETRYRVEGLVAEDGVTIFGMGSSAKTYVVLSICHAIARRGNWQGRETIPSKVLYLDYESRAKVLRRRWHRLEQGIDGGEKSPGFMCYMPARGIPVYEQLVTIRREIERTGAGMLVVDSAVAACGGDPSKPEFVTRMLNGLNTLGVPVVLIAHVTKDGGDEYPYGSIFWHNFARMTWNLKRVDSEESPDIEVGLFNKKANDDRRQKSFGLKLTFDDPEGEVSVWPWDLRSVPGLSSYLSASEQILAKMREDGRPMTSDQLHDVLPDLNKKTIQNTLSALKAHSRVTLLLDPSRQTKGEYALVSDRET